MCCQKDVIATVLQVENISLLIYFEIIVDFLSGEVICVSIFK